MTIGFNLPSLGSINGSTLDSTARGSGALTSSTAERAQEAQQRTELLSGKPTGPSQVSLSLAVTQPTGTFTDNKVIRERPSDQEAISAATFKTIIERAQSQRAGEGSEQSGFEPLSLKIDQPKMDMTPSFEKSVDAVRSMADPTGGRGESRLI